MPQKSLNCKENRCDVINMVLSCRKSLHGSKSNTCHEVNDTCEADFENLYFVNLPKSQVNLDGSSPFRTNDKYYIQCKLSVYLIGDPLPYYVLVVSDTNFFGLWNLTYLTISHYFRAYVHLSIDSTIQSSCNQLISFEHTFDQILHLKNDSLVNIHADFNYSLKCSITT